MRQGLEISNVNLGIITTILESQDNSAKYLMKPVSQEHIIISQPKDLKYACISNKAFFWQVVRERRGVERQSEFSLNQGYFEGIMLELCQRGYRNKRIVIFVSLSICLDHNEEHIFILYPPLSLLKKWSWIFSLSLLSPFFSQKEAYLCDFLKISVYDNLSAFTYF